jgi:hypothetical protein
MHKKYLIFFSFCFLSGQINGAQLFQENSNKKDTSEIKLLEVDQKFDENLHLILCQGIEEKSSIIAILEQLVTLLKVEKKLNEVVQKLINCKDAIAKLDKILECKPGINCTKEEYSKAFNESSKTISEYKKLANQKELYIGQRANAFWKVDLLEKSLKPEVKVALDKILNIDGINQESYEKIIELNNIISASKYEIEDS